MRLDEKKFRYASVCDGIGAVHVAWQPLGWECAWTSEIEPFPAAVVEHHFPGNMNLGDMTNIDLPGEVAGFIRPPSQWSGTSMYAIPMGQEVSVSAIQMACAMSVIANGGKLVRPRIIQAVQDKHGEIIKEFPPEELRDVISEKTAATMRDILSGVVTDGTGQLAKVDGYDVAGKTGTSQKIENGTYSHSKFIGSFVGFAPVKDPKVVVVVMLDEPYPQYYGGVVSAPVFSRVVKDTLRYLEIKPENITEVKREVELQSIED